MFYFIKIKNKTYITILYPQGYIVVGYRGTFAFGRDMSDVKVIKQTICDTKAFGIQELRFQE